MIRNSHPYQQNLRCNHCSKSLQDGILTSIYCFQCDNGIEMEAPFVEKGYERISRNRRELDMERKLNGYIKQFLNKYGSQSQLQQIRSLTDKLIRIKEMTPKSKGTREAAAVVVYCKLKQEIKLSIADFCKQNNLQHKSFNRKYIVYDKLYNCKQEMVALQQPIQKDIMHFIKQEQKNCLFEDQKSQQHEDLLQNQQEQSSNKLFYITFADTRKGIQAIFDDIFTKFHLKEKRQLIIQKLVTKVTSVSAHFFSEIQTQSINKPTQLYYLIFAILKSLKYKISFQKYCNIIRKNVGYILRKQLAYEVKKHYDGLYKKDKEIESESESFELIKLSDIKIQDNNSEILRIRFPMADSENQFDYQYYYEDLFND